MRRLLGEKKILLDFAIIFSSVLAAIVFAKTGILAHTSASTAGFGFIESFVAGMFFTSVFTTAPAIVALGEIMQIQPVYVTALFGALGAVVGDMVIFKFFKDRLSVHITELVRMRGGINRLKALFKWKFFRWFTFLLGGLIIASPLPDEMGIGLMGFSKMKTSLFILLSFVFNFIGITLIGLAARAL